LASEASSPAPAADGRDDERKEPSLSAAEPTQNMPPGVLGVLGVSGRWWWWFAARVFDEGAAAQVRPGCKLGNDEPSRSDDERRCCCGAEKAAAAASIAAAAVTG
jgi:hypothetical protein